MSFSFRRRTLAFVAMASVTTIGASVLLPITPAGAATTHVFGEGNGVAVSVHSDVIPGLELDDVLVELASAKSQLNTDGIGFSSFVAQSTAGPLVAGAAGVSLIDVGRSTASAPPPTTAQDTVPNASLPGIVAATAIHSVANAATAPPSSDATATITAATVGPKAAPLVDATVITGSASSSRTSAGVTTSGGSTGYSQVASARVAIPGLTVVIEAAEAQADAAISSAPGGNSASASCTVGRITINGSDLPIPACDGSSHNLLGLATLTFGAADTRVGSSRTSASIDAITITTNLGQTIVLGHADASAAIRVADLAVCNAARPPSSGSAMGRVIGVDSPLLGVGIEVAQADAAVGQNGVQGTPFKAIGDAVGAHVHTTLAPIDTRLGGSRATAPPTMTDTNQLVTIPAGLPLAGSALASTATARSSKLVPPEATSAATVAGATLVVPGITGLNATLAADAASARRATDVRSTSSASAQQLNLLIGATPISVSALQASAEVTANGVSGGGTATSGYTIATLQVGTLVVSPLDRQPGDVVVFPPAPLPPLVRLTFGTTSTTIAPNGFTASTSVDAITIDSLLTNDRIVLGHADASATFAAAGPRAYQKLGVDVGDDGDSSNDAAAHPGELVALSICIGNTGTDTLTNVVSRTDFDPAFEIVDAPIGATIVGQRVTTAPITLASATTESFTILVRIRPGTPASGKAAPIARTTTTAAQLPAPMVGQVRVPVVL